jgi:hypothetical protein
MISEMFKKVKKGTSLGGIWKSGGLRRIRVIIQISFRNEHVWVWMALWVMIYCPLSSA